MATRASRVKYWVDRTGGFVNRKAGSAGSQFLYTYQNPYEPGDWDNVIYSICYQPGIDYPLCKRTVKFFEKNGYVKGFPFADPTQGTA